MKKALLVLFIVFFASAAWAEVKFDMSGSFHARGMYFKNFTEEAPAASYESGSAYQYDGDINLYPKIIVDNTTLNFAIAIRDETWGNPSGSDDSYASNSWDPDRNNTYNKYTSSKDDNISIERAWLTHKFISTGTTLDVGLMDGQGWATSFGDYIMGRYRVKITQQTPVGVIGGLVEKDVEMSDYLSANDGEKDDYDSYAIFGVTKVGTVYVKPLFFFVNNSAAEVVLPGVLGAPLANGGLGLYIDSQDGGHDATQVLYIALGFDGTLGPLEFESEFGYKKYDAKGAIRNTEAYPGPIPAGTDLYDFDNSWYIWGAYVNVWKTLDSMTPGLTFAYGSWAEEGGPLETGNGWDNRDDFCSNLILGDWIAWGNSYSGDDGEDLVGMTLIKPYISNIKTPIQNLTASGSFGYIMSNQDNGNFADDFPTLVPGVVAGGAKVTNKYKDATAWEVDLGLAYKITPNLTYSVDYGYADISYDVTGIEDPDAIQLLAHKIKFTF